MRPPFETKFRVVCADDGLEIIIPPTEDELPDGSSKGMIIAMIVIMVIFIGIACFNVLLACLVFISVVLPFMILTAKDRYVEINSRKRPTADNLYSSVIILQEGIKSDNDFYPFYQGEGPLIGYPACHVYDKSIKRVVYIPIVLNMIRSDCIAESENDSYEIWCKSQEEADWLLYEIESFLKHRTAVADKNFGNTSAD